MILQKRIVLIAIVLVFAVIAYRLYLRYNPAPLTEAIARDLIIGSHVAEVTTTDGMVLPGPDSDIQFDGLYPVSWGTVAIYHSEHMHGWTVFTNRHGTWTNQGGMWASIDPTTQSGPVYYSHDPVIGYTEDELYAAEVVMGRVTLDEAAEISVRFDDQQRIHQPLRNGRFALFAYQHGAACELIVRTADGKVLQNIRLDPFVPFFADPERYDCQ